MSKRQLKHRLFCNSLGHPIRNEKGEKEKGKEGEKKGY